MQRELDKIQQQSQAAEEPVNSDAASAAKLQHDLWLASQAYEREWTPGFCFEELSLKFIDSQANCCFGCGAIFSTFVRRHHCRFESFPFTYELSEGIVAMYSVPAAPPRLYHCTQTANRFVFAIHATPKLL